MSVLCSVLYLAFKIRTSSRVVLVPCSNLPPSQFLFIRIPHASLRSCYPVDGRYGLTGTVLCTRLSGSCIPDLVLPTVSCLPLAPVKSGRTWPRFPCVSLEEPLPFKALFFFSLNC